MLHNARTSAYSVVPNNDEQNIDSPSNVVKMPTTNTNKPVKRKRLLAVVVTKRPEWRPWGLLLVSFVFAFFIAKLFTPMSSTIRISFLNDQCNCPSSEQHAVSKRKRDIETADYALFYHVFINPESTNSSKSIIMEQLAQWQNSSLANVTLYYGLVGETTHSFPCPPKAKCKQLFSEREGWEKDTLQKLYEYCIDNPTHKVVYLHSKGTFHDNKENRILRRVLTRSACSDECYVGLNSGCDVCSARFSALPRWHVSGNMWAATCHHVNELIAPEEFEASVRNFVQNYSQTERKGSMPFDSDVGMGRFADEHWIHTFPRIRPCDVFTDAQLKWGYPPFNENSGLELQPAPRWPLEEFKSGMDPMDSLFRLKYRLAEFQHLYGEIPPADHFIWMQYVEGDML